MAGTDRFKELNLALFHKLLSTNFVGRNVVHRNETTSTMTIAAEEAKQGARPGTLVFAEHQTQGQGSVQGRTWDSSTSANLLFTLLVPQKGNIPFLPAITAISMTTACRQMGVNAWIKWPNDTWVKGRKVAGMKIDAVSAQEFALVGVGINANELFEDAKDNRGSLRQFLGKVVCREELLAHFCNTFERLLNGDKGAILPKFQKLERLKGQQVTVFPNKREDSKDKYDATVVGYKDFANMVVRRQGAAQDQTHTLTAEEITVRPADAEAIGGAAVLWRPNLPQDLTATWKNQLGSTMALSADANGNLEGMYHTQVGNTHVDHPLRGRWTVTADGGAVLSFSVAWEKVDPSDPRRSATAWAGRVYVEPDNQTLKLSTTWVLQLERPESDDWEATLINKDVFYKV